MPGSKTKIKMCGMFRECDIETINEIRPDYCGFIINFPKSHRSVNVETLKKLSSMLDKNIVSVGVFVDEDPGLIEELLNSETIQIAQLHGSENNATIERIMSNTKKPVIKAFCVSGSIDEYEKTLNIANDCSSEHLLIDTGKGGGIAMNFSMMKNAIENVGFDRPYFLAGGLDTSNIKKAVEILHPYAVDLSGGLETNKKKDPERMRQVMDIMNEL